MASLLDHVLVWSILIIPSSVGWDLYTYSDRQDRWEREHPGATYIPGYKRTLRKQERLRKKNGVL